MLAHIPAPLLYRLSLSPGSPLSSSSFSPCPEKLHDVRLSTQYETLIRWEVRGIEWCILTRTEAMGIQKLLAWFHGDCSLIPRDWRFHQDAAPRGGEFDFALLHKYGNWANRNHLISESRALYKSFLSAGGAHVRTRWHMWLTRLAAVGVTDGSQAGRKEGRREGRGRSQTDTAEGRGSGEWLGGGRSCGKWWESERREGGSEGGREAKSLPLPPYISYKPNCSVMCTEQ